jgi:hypothetical protein
MSWICWKETLDPDPLTLLNPDPIRIRIRNTARKREKAGATLLNSFFSTMSCIWWKEKLDPDPLTLLKSGSNSDPDPQHCRKARKSCCYLVQLLLLDYELDLLEGEAGSGYTDPIESGFGSATLPESEKKLLLPC